MIETKWAVLLSQSSHSLSNMFIASNSFPFNKLICMNSPVNLRHLDKSEKFYSDQNENTFGKSVKFGKFERPYNL